MTTLAPPPSSAAKAKLLRRAQVIARLRHPNLVRMLPLPGGAGLVPVETGARRLADFTLPAGTFKRFDLEQVVRLMLDVLSGLSALHEAPVDDEPFVHGQVCPQHVYVGEHGTAKLIPLTSSHLLTPGRIEPNGYAAPELLLGDPFDLRADLFSVGAMLWEALAGRRLFPDPSVEAVVQNLIGRKLPRLVAPPRASWARPLCAIVERAIASEPAARYGSATELSNAIAQAVGEHLAKVGADSWQDEAPTPVLQPRLHFPQLRSTVPPATVVDVEPEPSSARAPDEPSHSAARASAELRPVPSEPEATVRPARGRALLWGLGSLMATASILSLQHRTVTFSASGAQPVTAMATAPAAPAPASAAPVAVAAASAPAAPATPQVSAAPPAAVTPEPGASSRPRAKPRPAATKLPPLRSAPPATRSDADYGI